MKKPKHLKKFSIVIKDHNWDFCLLSDHGYETKHIDDEGDTSGAMTIPHLKLVDFKKSEFTLAVVRHELFHILVYSSNIGSSSLTTDQMEELCCSIVQHDIHLISTLTERIYVGLTE